jgi:hypothetical protein
MIDWTPSTQLLAKIRLMYEDNQKGLSHQKLAIKYGYHFRNHVTDLLSWYKKNVLKGGENEKLA